MRARFTSHCRFALGALALCAGCSSGSTFSAPGDRDAESQIQDQDAGSDARVREDVTASESDAASGGPRVEANEQCNQVDLIFDAPRPSIFILVDRSSSMFDQNFWNPLKQGVLAVVKKLEAQVSFGFSSYTGQNGGTCPDLTTLDRIAVNNYDAIARAYDALKAPPYKGETPTARALEDTTTFLLQHNRVADGAAAPTAILLVTDGEPDFCDDGNVKCARDAVVGAAQAAQRQGISTFIFSIGGQVDREHLGDVANAGIGAPVVDRGNAVMQQCGTPKATYAASAGNAPYFEPNVNDQSAIERAIESVVSSVRSCTFDLQGALEIDLSAADQGVVELDGKRLVHGAADGFRMNSPTQLELLGAACESLRKPEIKRVNIDFPCRAITFL